MHKTIDGYGGYYDIHSDGRVYSRHKNIFLKSGKNKRGYRVVILYDGKGNKTPKYIHRLVAEAFIPNPKNLGTVDHRDNNKENNDMSNLRWFAGDDNIREYHKQNWKIKNPKGEIVYFHNLRKFCREHNFNRSAIVETIKGKRKKAYGWTAA